MLVPCRGLNPIQWTNISRTLKSSEAATACTLFKKPWVKPPHPRLARLPPPAPSSSASPSEDDDDDDEPISADGEATMGAAWRWAG